MAPTAHLHLHLPDFDVGGTEQWALAMGIALTCSPYTLSITAGARLDTAAGAIFKMWRPIAIEHIPDHAYVIAPSDIERLVARNRRVIAVAHGMNPYYQGLFAFGGYYKAVAVSRIATTAFPPGVDVAVIHNGVDLDRLRTIRSKTEARRSLLLPEDAVVIGHVGRTSAGKNPLAAALAAGAIHDGVALYVGPDPSAEVSREACALAHCRFLTADAARPISDCYAAMDVCLVASRSEGFSLVTAEAWASLTPVVSTPVGISLEHSDLVIPIPASPGKEVLAAAVGAALDPRRRSVLDHARAVVHEHYSLSAMARRWRAYLKTVVE